MNGRRALLLAGVVAGCSSSAAPVPPPPVTPPAKKSVPVAPVESRPAPVESVFAPEGKGTVIRAPRANDSTVVIRLAFYSGSIDDPVGKEGLTRLTGRLMLEGGTEAHTYAELLEQLYPWAAEIGVQTDKEQTVFFGRVHRDYADRFIPLLVDVVKRPRFDAEAFTRVRKRQVDDLNRRLKATDDQRFGNALLEQLMYGGAHPYGHHPGGSAQGLAVIRVEDVKAHADAVFGRRRLLIGIGGAFKPEHERMLTSALAELPEGKARPAEIPAGELPTDNQVLIAVKPDAQSVSIAMGFPHGARRGAPDWPALVVVQSFLGEHGQGHGVLMKELRNRRGLSRNGSAHVEAFRPDGSGTLPMVNISRRRQHFSIWIQSVAAEDAALSIRLALVYLERLVKEGLTEEEVLHTAQFLQSYSRLWAVSSMQRLGYAIDDHFYGTKSYLAGLREALTGLTVEQVNAAIRQYLRAQPLYLAVVTPNAEVVLAGLDNPSSGQKKYRIQTDAVLLADDAAANAARLQISEENVTVVPAQYTLVR